MGKSKQSTEVLNLGKTIVEELQFQNSVDTLSRWMAHYLSELFVRLEQEDSTKSKKEIEKECVDIILKLWESKAAISSNIDPIEKLSSALSVLGALVKDTKTYGIFGYRNAEVENNAHGKFAAEIDRVSYQMIQLTLVFSIANKEFSKTKKWKEELGSTLSDMEKRLIDQLDQYLNRIDFVAFKEEQNESILDMTPLRRKKVFIGKLKSLIKDQKDAINELQRSINDD